MDESEPEGPTVAQARSAFFAASGLPADGGYDESWAEADFGPLRYRVPNTEARGDALRIHDLHHVATGYETDWRGEAEISAWELGSGLGTTPYAWITVLFGVFTGLVAHYRPTLRAFARGRRSKNLYGHTYDPSWLRWRLATLRAELAVTQAPTPQLGDQLAFALWSLAALLFGLASAPFVAALVLMGSARRVGVGQCPLAC